MVTCGLGRRGDLRGCLQSEEPRPRARPLLSCGRPTRCEAEWERKVARTRKAGVCGTSPAQGTARGSPLPTKNPKFRFLAG